MKKGKMKEWRSFEIGRGRERIGRKGESKNVKSNIEKVREGRAEKRKREQRE